MKQCTNFMKPYFNKLSPKQKQWAWFVGLWLFGLFTVSMIGYAIKFLMFWQL